MFRSVFTFKRLFDFKGRASRREWLLLHAAYIVSFMLPLLVVAALPGDPAKLTGLSSVVAAISYAICTIILLAGLVPLLAVAFRRLHDQGNSGAFLLLGLIPVVGWIFILIMMLYPGQRYENEYGPDPRDPLPTETGHLDEVFS